MTTSTTTKKRYVLVGTGARSGIFFRPVTGRYKESSELVGLCDTNEGRLEYTQQRLLDECSYHTVPYWLAGDFDKMVKETKPDVVTVASMDCTHDHYIVRAMELGCDVITEKPMTTDAAKCRRIFDAVKRTGKTCRVAFNMRFNPGSRVLKKLILDDTIGQVLHVNLQYWIDTSHGADYFRRWHREKDKSGGLMVHKATHHLDIVNWVIDAVPDTVFGFGRLAFYGRANAEKRGLKVTYDRYAGNDTSNDPFALDIHAKELYHKLYWECEKYDGYVRDRNVFGDNITAEDTMSVLVNYRTGATLSYTLNAYIPREGWHLVLSGTKGQIDYQRDHLTGHKVTVLPMFGKPYEVPIPREEGGHGGADPLLQEQLFSPNPPADILRTVAQHGQGAASVLIGTAANASFETGQPVKIRDICPEIGPATRLSELP